jgi:hypothetical protein
MRISGSQNSVDYIRVRGIEQKRQTDSELMTLRFSAVQLLAASTIILARVSHPPGTPRANEMEATRPLV